MEKLNFYIMPDEYIAFMSNYDEKVCYNKKHKRPYIGIILKVENTNYFAPFTSPKEKHQKMKQTLDYVKMDDGKLGLINLNNMIPVPLNICEKLELKDIKYSKYQKLMLKQYLWCNIDENYKEIIEKASRLYYIVTSGKCGKNLLKRCCNYKLLEEKYIEYNAKI